MKNFASAHLSLKYSGLGGEVEASDQATVLEFITSRPPGTNVYAALIPFLTRMTAVANPGWMSIVLMVLILAHFSILIFSALVLAYHIRRKDWFLVTRQRNGLLKPNRTLVEALGAFSYAALSLVDMSCQLYIDYQRKPVRGKILIFAWRYPIAWLAFWCIMWNCITGRIRAIWDPTFRDASEGGYDSMPKWVVWLLNSIFVFFVGVFTIVDPAVLIPAHNSHAQFLNTLRGVENALLTASKAPDAISYSLTKLYTILEPLDSIPTTIDQLAASVKVYYYFSAGLDFGMMAVYAVFIFLTYRQYRVLRNHEKTGRVTDKVDQVLKFDYKAELKTIFVEAVFIFFMLFAFIPMFAWGLTTNGSNQFLTSPTSVTVPALTLGAAAAIVGNVVMGFRLVAIRRLERYYRDHEKLLKQTNELSDFRSSTNDEKNESDESC